MQKLILSSKTRKSILSHVWGVWILRKTIPLAALALVAVIESFFVSFGSVFANALGAAQNIGSFSTYWFSAVLNAEFYVLAGATVLLVGGIVFVRGTILDLQFFSSLKRKRVSSF